MTAGGDEAGLLETLRGLGLVGRDETPVIEPLRGGVSSDILRVDAARGAFCVKRALAQLRVSAAWHAPVARNAFEVAWLQTAGAIVPDAVPKVLAHAPESGLFAMQYLPPAQYPNWKQELRAGRVDEEAARALGRRLGAIHAATADDPALARQFAADRIFHEIRLAPYLETSAAAHPALAARLNALVATTAGTRRALVHGDVSPKNILLGPRGPVFVDAECAWYGDPAFDLAFCLNHLLLKCLWVPPARAAFLRSFAALAGAYLEAVTWEAPGEVERRAAHLLPGLLLARVDGKSPVEYLETARDLDLVRRVADCLLREPPARLADIAQHWSGELDARGDD